MREKKISLKLTYSCKGNCIYCSLRKKTWELHKIKEMDTILIDKIWEKLNNSEDIFFNEIHLTGGEPGLYPFLEYALSKAKENNKKISITTSGWILSQKNWYEIFKKFSVHKFYISMDDPDKKINDAIRGQGSFDKAHMAIKQAIMARNELGIPEVTVISVITRKNILRLMKMIEFLRKYEVNRWLPSYMEASYAYPDLIPERRDLEILSFQRNNNVEFDELLGDSFKPYFIPWELIYHGILPEDREYKYKKCETLGNILIIHPNGNIYSCYGSEHNETLPIYNLYSEKTPSFVEIALSQKNMKFKNCRYCPEPYQKSIDLKGNSYA